MESYYEEKLKIEIDKLKIHLEKEMTNNFQNQNSIPKNCCCQQKIDCNSKKTSASPSDLNLVLNSLSQINVGLQKRNEELTNNLLTILIHLKNEKIPSQKDETSSSLERDSTTKKVIEENKMENLVVKKKSQMCCVM